MTPLLLAALLQIVAPPVAVSTDSEPCVTCHETFQPGLVGHWRRSRHSQVTLASAVARPAAERRISLQSADGPAAGQVVACHECHGRNPAAHPDTFDHFGARVHTVVTPEDCRACHPVEVDEYAPSKKAHAHGNLVDNPVFAKLLGVALGRPGGPPSEHTQASTCLACHGTEVKVTGKRTVTGELGEVELPKLTGWPNQGVGRQNPDGSRGACTSCHARHEFSLRVARSPETCSQCHLEPDVPAWDVYRESKHGNLLMANRSEFAWDRVPWRVGVDFTAPTCATCHSSLVVRPDGETVAARSHDFGARLWVRLFGLPYAHPQPLSGQTTTLRNADGLPLPTAFDGRPAPAGLLSPTTQAARQEAMRRVCGTCHSQGWADGHFARLDTAVAESNELTLAATRLVQAAWQRRLADPAHPFDEPIEQHWVRQWLFYGNSVRYAAAMSGPDYAAFKNGWWLMNTNLAELREWLQRR